MLRLFTAYLAAVLSTAILCSILSTQFVIAGLQSIEVAIPLSVRLQMTIQDFGILQTLLPAIAACFVVGFGVAALCVRWIGGSRAAWFSVAGVTSLITLYLLLKLILEHMPISGARSLSGLVAQGLAGGLGGWLFAKLSAKQTEGIQNA
jgi:hypothetical protein